MKALTGRNSEVNSVLSLMEGHYRFLKRSTGVTNDATEDHYTINEDGVVSNNRHFIAYSRMAAQPNGDATTEAQTLLILGAAHAYIATKDQRWLDLAEKTFDAHVEYYFAGKPIPTTPERWVCNWLVNGKEPTLAHYPLDPSYPTHGGFKGVEMTFVDGLTQIPHGSPYFGEYLDLATFAFDGGLGWDSMVASVYPLTSAGEIDWSAGVTTDTTWNVDWIIDSQGNKINSDGDFVEQGLADSEKGKIQLQDTTVQGTHKLNFACKVPVELGGYMLQRNEIWHNRPVNVPVPEPEMGNAADAQEWLVDASYVLWKITGDVKYYNAYKACVFTSTEYVYIDSVDKFFRQSLAASTPFTDGISYDWSYPADNLATYGRDSLGYITLSNKGGIQSFLETQSITFRLKPTSRILVTLGGQANDGTGLTSSFTLLIGDEKLGDTGTLWTRALPTTTGLTPTAYDIPLSDLVLVTNPATNDDYLVASLSAVTDYGGAVTTLGLDTTILGTRTGNVISSLFPDDDAGLIIGFWLTTNSTSEVASITYKADGDFNIRVTDDDGWRWWWMAANTNGEWVTLPLLKSGLTLSGYQPDAAGRPSPTTPNYTAVDQLVVVMDDSYTNITFSYYCVNDLPEQLVLTDGYAKRLRLTQTAATDYTGVIGDCVIEDPRWDSLYCSPGVIPFSNIYTAGAEQFDGWHGLPYPGYQYPFIYLVSDNADADTFLNNMIEFMHAAQAAYGTQFGQTGPVMSAYVWDRWDNIKYGTPNTWTMYNWGEPNEAWSGYQARAMQSGCRCWHEMVMQDRTVPAKLIEYCDNWINWLTQFMEANGNQSPTYFPPTALPEVLPYDFTAHMVGLFLAGACSAAMAGSTNTNLDKLITMLVNEFITQYAVYGPDDVMNGSWSPAPRTGTDNGQYFGFYAGEILRGLSLYMMYKNNKTALY